MLFIMDKFGLVHRFGQLDLQPYLPESFKLSGRCAIGPNDGQGHKFIVFTNKETILLKKVTIPRATSIAKRLQDPKGEMPMEEIVKAVHQCRKEKRQEGV
ncbi:MAG: hypothetical protein QME81_09750 [bacterium]|nr:hypothetical protein [bacterium]